MYILYIEQLSTFGQTRECRKCPVRPSEDNHTGQQPFTARQRLYKAHRVGSYFLSSSRRSLDRTIAAVRNIAMAIRTIEIGRPGYAGNSKPSTTPRTTMNKPQYVSFFDRFTTTSLHLLVPLR